MQASECAVGLPVRWAVEDHEYEGMLVKVAGEHVARRTGKGVEYTEYEVRHVWVLALTQDGEEIPPIYPDEPLDREEEWVQVNPALLSPVEAG